MLVSRSLSRSAQLDLDRRAVEGVALSDAVLEVTRVGEVDRGRAVDEEHERRCRALRLGHVMETYLLAISITRRRVRGDGLRQQAMQVRGRDPFLALVHDRDGRIERVLDPAH